MELSLRLILVWVAASREGFVPGQVRPGMFEYSQINRWLSAPSAASVCEEDLLCGGFTYRGALTRAGLYQIYFFHFVVDVELDDEGRVQWDWTTYVAQRGYIVLPGRPDILHGHRLQPNTSVSLATSPGEGARLCRETPLCVAVAQQPESNLLYSLEWLDFHLTQPNSSWTTVILLSAKKTQISDQDALSSLNLCCVPAKPFMVPDHMSGKIARARCSIPPEQFLMQFVMRRMPVILQGCLSPALFNNSEFGGFSFDSIIHRLFHRPGNYTAASVYRPRLRREVINYIRGKNSSLDFPTVQELVRRTLASTEDLKAAPTFTHVGTPNDGALSMEQIVRMRRRGGVRAFVRLSSLVTDSDCYRAHLLPGGALGPGHEACLVLDGLWKPPPMPLDLYSPTQYDNDLAWIILSSANSGSQLHNDPDLMGAWNLLLSGRKWWAVHPAPLNIRKVDCNAKCSPGYEHRSNAEPWFSHLLPQLRERKLFGHSVLEFVQEPGEVLYLPHGMMHTIYNLDDTVALTENYLFLDALPNLVKAVAEDAIRAFVPSWKEARGIHLLYMQHANSETRAKMRAVYGRMEEMLKRFPNRC